MNQTSNEDREWNLKLHSLRKGEMSLEQALGTGEVIRRCSCGAEIINRHSPMCHQCLISKILVFIGELSLRVQNVPLVTCPKCGKSKYTRLCFTGICIDCETEQSDKNSKMKLMQKTKSLQERVKGFTGTSFIEKSQNKEDECEIVPF
ncbi:MAG: hypothetical protein WC390_09100 [Sulfurimonas sp.]